MDPLWDKPSVGSPAAAIRAYRLMMRTLRTVRRTIPEIFRDPHQVPGEQVLTEAIAASTNPKLDATLRLAALTELQSRMRTVDPATPQRLFLTQPAQESAIARTIGSDLARLGRFDKALQTFIVDEQPGKALRAVKAGVHELSASERAGLLLALLVIRLGQSSHRILGLVLEALETGARPIIAGRWAWLDIELQNTGRAELRRIFLDPTTLTAWQLAASTATSLPRPPVTLKAKQQRRRWRQLANRHFKTLCKALVRTGLPSPIVELKDLCACEVQRLRMVTMPVIATYAAAELSSSSLEPGTWCRLIGFRAPDPPEDLRPQHVTLEGEPTETVPAPHLTGIDPGAESDLREQMDAGDLEASGVVHELRDLMGGARPEWRAALAALANGLHVQGPEHQTEELVVRWLSYLTTERRSKGKSLSDGTIRHYRGLLANRLLRILPSRLSELSEDELEAAYTEVIMSRRSPAQTGRVQAALASFDRYVREHHVQDLPVVSLPGFGGTSYAISSRIIVESEYQAGFQALRDGTIALQNRALAAAVRAFWILAYRFGLRRTEILGLQRCDLDDDVLRVRVNAARNLKTTNARRLLPTVTLPVTEREMINDVAAAKFSDDYLFFQHKPSAREIESHPVVAKVKQLLERVTADPHIHAHNLRHATATLHMLGILGCDLRVARHPYATHEPWILAAIRQAQSIDQGISGQLHQKSGRGNALAMMMGHGSELTTYEHYTHCFDLLLFLACWRGHFKPSKQHTWRHLFPPRHQAAQILAMLGLARTTQVETQDIPRLLERIAALRPAGITMPIAAEPTTPSTAPAVVTEGELPPLKLTPARLLKLPDAVTGKGYLKPQANRDSVVGLLEQFNRALPAHQDQLRELLWQWVESRRTNSNWASMTAPAARRWAKALWAVLPNVRLEVFHTYTNSARKCVKSRVAALHEPDSMNESRGRYCIRIADSRKKLTRHRSKSGRSRSRSQRSITWFLLAFTNYLGPRPQEGPNGPHDT